MRKWFSIEISFTYEKTFFRIPTERANGVNWNDKEPEVTSITKCRRKNIVTHDKMLDFLTRMNYTHKHTLRFTECDYYFHRPIRLVPMWIVIS